MAAVKHQNITDVQNVCGIIGRFSAAGTSVNMEKTPMKRRIYGNYQRRERNISSTF